jgi:hypothetical protein
MEFLAADKACILEEIIGANLNIIFYRFVFIVPDFIYAKFYFLISRQENNYIRSDFDETVVFSLMTRTSVC